MSYSYISSLAIEKVKAELKASYKFIKHDGLILETFATNLLKLNSGDVPKTIEYLETLSKKDILDKLQVIIKELETTKEIVEIIKTSIQVETGKLKDKQAKVDALDKETDDLLKVRDSLKSDLVKLKIEQDTTKTEFQKLQESREAISKEKIIQLEHTKTLLQDTIDGVFRNEVYEDEFNIPEHEYVQSHPLVQLKEKIYDVKPNEIEYCNIVINPKPDHDKKTYYHNDVKYLFSELQKYSNKIKPLFTEEIVFNDKEYIIMIKIHCINDIFKLNPDPRHGSSLKDINYINKLIITYFTNYGRFSSNIYICLI